MIALPLSQENTKSSTAVLPVYTTHPQPLHDTDSKMHSPSIKSRITLARAILVICIASMMMALLHIHYTSFYNRGQVIADIDNQYYDYNNDTPYPAHKKPQQVLINSSPAPTPTETGDVSNETDLSVTVNFNNGTIKRKFKPAFYKNPEGARKEMGSFLDTLAERSSKMAGSSLATKGFFSYLPMGGGNNQFSSLEKAALLAKDLNRTLIVPPISPSSHIKVWSGVRYSEFYDLEKFSADSGISIVEWDDVKQTPVDPPKDLTRHWNDFSEDLPCIANGGIGVNDKNLYDHFRPQFLFNFKSIAPPVEDVTRGKSTDFDHARDVLLQDKEAENPDLWKCISCPYFLNGPTVNGRSWDEVGKHMKFSEKAEAMADEILDTLLPKSQDETRRHPEFIIIHLRRGDIVNKCKKGQSEQECLVQIEAIAKKVDEIEKKRQFKVIDAVNSGIDVSPKALERLPVLVATNEKRPEELEKLNKLGWIMLDHGDKEFDAEGIEIPSVTKKLGTMTSLGPFYPPMLDAVLLTRGDYLIGMSNSRMSQLATQRGAAWYGHSTMLM
ncbi:hypothetical protein BGZ76_000648 [Entomortierella beljakovae]|nr:hypothetical protein BGZ76_000648 [Entomortierella beljakovae]